MLQPSMKAIQFVGLHWARVWNGHDGDGMAALFHPEGTYTDPFAGTIPRRVIPQMIARIAELFPDYAFALASAVTEATVGGQRTLALQWKMTGTEVGSKRPVELYGVDFLLFDGPLIIKADTYFDMATLQAQSGLTHDALVLAGKWD